MTTIALAHPRDATTATPMRPDGTDDGTDGTAAGRRSEPSPSSTRRRRPVALLVWSTSIRLAAMAVARVRRCVARRHDDRGQATTEYALVLLAAALVALLVIAWATAGGGGARISRLFNRVIDAVIDRV